MDLLTTDGWKPTRERRRRFAFMDGPQPSSLGSQPYFSPPRGSVLAVMVSAIPNRCQS